MFSNLLEFWSLINWLDFGYYAGKSNLRYYKREIERPCKNGDPQGFERLQVLIDSICLRRTKTDKKPDGSPIVDLPTKTFIMRDVEFTEDEAIIYRQTLKDAQAIVRRYLRRGELLKNYAHVFALMMRLRQICCHWELWKEVDWKKTFEDKENLARELEGILNQEQQAREEGGAGQLDDDAKKLMQQLRDMIRSGVTEDCSICLDDLKTPVITPCAHVFCRTCIERVIKDLKPPSCPLCRAEIKNRNLLLGNYLN